MAHSETQVGRTNNETVVYEAPDISSKGIGRYRQGTSVRLEVPSYKGWYKIYFSKPVRNLNFGWVRVEDVLLNSQAFRGVDERLEYSSDRPYRHWFHFGLRDDLYTPTDYLKALGEGTGTIPTLGLTFLGYSIQLGQSVLLSSDVFYSHYLQSSGINVGATHSMDLFVLNTYLYFKVFNGRRGDIWVGGGVGGTLGMVANKVVNGNELQTYNIIVPAFYGKILFRWQLARAFSLYADAGYRYLEFGAVNYLLANQSQQEASMSLSGIYAGTGVIFHFGSTLR